MRPVEHVQMTASFFINFHILNIFFLNGSKVQIWFWHGLLKKGNLLFEVDFPLPPASPQLTETKYQDAD